MPVMSVETSVLPRIMKELLKNPILTKSAKSFGAAYIYVLVPRFIAIISRAVRNKESIWSVLRKIGHALRNALHSDRFPAFVSTLILTTHVVDLVVRRLAGIRARSSSNARVAILGTSAFVSSILQFWRFKQKLFDSGRKRQNPELSDTLDLTTVMLVRGVDVLVHVLASSRGITQKSLHSVTDLGLFWAACSVIMFCWFYYPERLSRSYQRWITRAAEMQDELIEALRLVRNGGIAYGEDRDANRILSDMAVKCGIDPKVADFSNPTQLPCFVIHQNVHPNCEIHALWRFYRGFMFSMSLYTPINLIFKFNKNAIGNSMAKILVRSCRSSAFLAAYIMLNWYSVCLVRTRLGPVLFPKATPQQLEDTYGPTLGAVTCGLSSLIESPSRRGELALFVAPKAVVALLPQNFSSLYPATETLMFATSFAVLATATRESPQNIRGIFRRLLGLAF